MPREHKILVVEDDEALRYAFVTALAKSGFKVDEAASGPDAVRLLNQNGATYCAAMLDMLVPGVHGSSLIGHVAKTSPKLAVVAVTGFPDRVLFADPADRHVVKAIFVKPAEPSDIAAFLQSRCSRE